MVQTIKSGITALVLLLSACATTSSSIYFSSQAAADASLTAFDKNNPDCQLWTNWQKMCSRTGEGGATRCITDSQKSVRPSTPFCAEPSAISFSLTDILDLGQKKSAERFYPQYISSLEKGISSNKDNYRPFSGSNLSSRRHPYCNVWATENEGKAICAEGESFPELPRCESIADDNVLRNNVLYCAVENTSKIADCPEPRGLSGSRRQVSRPPYPYVDKEAEDIIAISDKEDYILSIYCER